MKKFDTMLLKLIISPTTLFFGLLPRSFEYITTHKNIFVLLYAMVFLLLSLSYLFVRGATAIKYGVKTKFIVLDSLVVILGIILAISIDFTSLSDLVFSIFAIPLFINNYYVLRKNSKGE